MKIGFPVIHGETCPRVVITLVPEENPSIHVTERNRNETLFVEAFPGTYHRYINALFESKLGLQIDIEHQNETSTVLSAADRNNVINVRIFGNSGTLALFVLAELGDQIVKSTSNEVVFFSGEIFENAGAYNFKDITSVQEKASACKGHDFWLSKANFDELDPKGRDRVLPFLTAFQKPDWLLHELCDKYGFAAPYQKGIQPTQDFFCGPSVDERRLFEEALGYALNRLNVQTNLTQYFINNPPRELLPVQRQALIDESNGLFTNARTSKLRHVLISGPTGCGKTSLMHALVLNAMHNRKGGALYVGPVKALVEEFHAHIKTELALLLPQQNRSRIVISTSDFWRDDAYISRGEFGLACMVYEKASILFTADQEQKFLQSISLLVVDELHMLQDNTRGDVVDVLIAKCFRENLRRANNDKPLIQLAFVSTENVADKIKALDDLKIDGPADTRIDPIVISSEIRDPSILHRIGVFNRYQTPHITVLDICNFAHNKDRRLEEKDITELEVRLADTKTAYKDIKKGKKENNIYIDKIIELMHEEMHHTIIVACNAISICDSLAGLLSSRLSHDLDSRTSEDAAFLKDLIQSGLPPNTIGLIRLWRSRGVFVHHGQLPAKLRVSTGHLFREKILPNTRPKVLFTTETLTYGVNLTASCIVLIDMNFRREDPVDPKIQLISQPLTANQYHNLLGRAGRKGFSLRHTNNFAGAQVAPAPTAIIMLDESLFHNPSSLRDFLTDFYGVAKNEDLISTIAHIRDHHRFNPRVPAQDEQKYKLTDLSFSIFRTVLECVRTAGYGKNIEEIKSVFQLTLGYQVSPDHMKSRLDRLFAFTLRKCGEYNNQDEGTLALVDLQNTRYTIKHTANALIDTGTTLHSLIPIDVWVREVFGGDFPPEAIIPGIVVAPEFTKVACSLFGDSVFKLNNDSDIKQSARLEQAKMCAHFELGKVIRTDTDDFLRRLDRFLASEKFTDALAIVPNSTTKTVVVYRLITAICLWIGGANIELIQKEFKEYDESIDRRWLPKHSDRLEQLAKMIYRFFSVGQGHLSPRMKLELPKLAARMKHGIPFLASPYVNLVGTDGVLPRLMVNHLFTSIPDSFQLLNDAKHVRANTFPILNKCLEGIAGNTRTSAEVVEVVRKSYFESLKYFFSRLVNNEVIEICSDAYEAMRSSTDAHIFSDSWKSGKLLKVFIAPDLVDEPGVVISTANVVFCCQHIADALNHEHVYLLNWHEIASSHHWTITPCAFTLIQVMLKRRQLTNKVLAEALIKHSKTKIDVHWVASNLWLDESIQSMTSFRESMLSFLEPQS